MPTYSSEFERISLLRALFAAKPHPGFEVGIGDDAAVMSGTAANRLVWSVDAAVDRVHFRLDWLTFEQVGYRATMAALSDIAAMGAQPVGVTSSLILPPSVSDDDLLHLGTGQATACSELGVAIVGGNLATGSELSITTGVLGATERPLLRSGARPGDEVWLAGSLGWSYLALQARILGRSTEQSAGDAFAKPRARVMEGLAANQSGATSAIDVSDGLVQDLWHLARASHVRVTLEKAALHNAELETSAKVLGLDPWHAVLQGGEDYALLVTLPPGSVVPGFRKIGWCEAEQGPDRVLLTEQGGFTPVAPRGHDHFRDPGAK